MVITNQRTTNNDLMIAVNTSAGARPHAGKPARAFALQTVEGTVLSFNYKSDVHQDIKDITSANVDADLNISVVFSLSLIHI